jgi:hypothetical protein
LDPVEIYELAQDPGEQHNIANQRAELANSLIEKINHIYQDAKKRNIKKHEIDEELRKQLKALGYIR